MLSYSNFRFESHHSHFVPGEKNLRRKLEENLRDEVKFRKAVKIGNLRYTFFLIYSKILVTIVKVLSNFEKLAKIAMLSKIWEHFTKKPLF